MFRSSPSEDHVGMADRGVSSSSRYKTQARLRCISAVDWDGRSIVAMLARPIRKAIESRGNGCRSTEQGGSGSKRYEKRSETAASLAGTGGKDCLRLDSRRRWRDRGAARKQTPRGGGSPGRGWRGGSRAQWPVPWTRAARSRSRGKVERRGCAFIIAEMLRETRSNGRPSWISPPCRLR